MNEYKQFGKKSNHLGYASVLDLVMCLQQPVETNEELIKVLVPVG